MSFSGVDLSTIPAGTPPPGVTSNFINPPTLRPTILIVWFILLAITIPVVICRTFSSYKKAGKLGSDDWSMIIATIFTVGYIGFMVPFSKIMARHRWDIPMSWFDDTFEKNIIVSIILPTPASFFAKLSILLFYKKVFFLERGMKLLVLIGILLNVLANLPFDIIGPIYCAPHKGGTWDFAVAEKCQEVLPFNVGIGGLNLLSDVYITILPLPSIFRLNLSRRRKVGLVLIFLTTLLAIICAALMVYYYAVLLIKKHNDSTWITGKTILLRGIELNIAIIVGCTPGLASFFATYINHSNTHQSSISGIRNWLRPLHTRTKNAAAKYNSKSQRISYLGFGTIGGTPYRGSSSHRGSPRSSKKALTLADPGFENAFENTSATKLHHAGYGYGFGCRELERARELKVVGTIGDVWGEQNPCPNPNPNIRKVMSSSSPLKQEIVIRSRYALDVDIIRSKFAVDIKNEELPHQSWKSEGVGSEERLEHTEQIMILLEEK